jgi:Mn-containing catalase
MFYHDKRLQYTVRVDNPDPQFAHMLQQAIGGVEGEIRVCLQYLFQAWGSRGPVKYRDMILETGTEEISHIEMLAHAVALNLQNAPSSVAESAVQSSGVVGAILGGQSTRDILGSMDPRHLLSTGLAALPSDANGVPFDCSHVYASGNIMADMYCNVAAEATGRALATRLYNLTDDPGMKDFLSFLIARDTMHQQQWLAVIEELGGHTGLPIPNSFDQGKEAQEFSYVFLGTMKDGSPPPQGRFSTGPSLDGRAQFTGRPAEPMGQEPVLGPARSDSGAQTEQMTDQPPVMTAPTATV